jgi:hypothetical protein
MSIQQKKDDTKITEIVKKEIATVQLSAQDKAEIEKSFSESKDFREV